MKFIRSYLLDRQYFFDVFGTSTSISCGVPQCSIVVPFVLYVMSLVTRKPVFGVSDQVRPKSPFSANETSWGLEISAIASRDIILFR